MYVFVIIIIVNINYTTLPFNCSVIIGIPNSMSFFPKTLLLWVIFNMNIEERTTKLDILSSPLFLSF